MRQVLANLVDNARKYARPEVPPEIEVSAAREGDRVVVSVRDNGIGVPAEDRERVFDRFQRAGATRSASRGSGIGLSICRTIVERHGGTIACLPVEDGPGSVFRFRPARGRVLSETNVSPCAGTAPRARRLDRGQHVPPIHRAGDTHAQHRPRHLRRPRAGPHHP